MPEQDTDGDESWGIPMPQTRNDLNTLVNELRKQTNAADNIEVVRRRRIARVNAAADERIEPIVARIRALVKTILIAASTNWDEFNKDATAPLTMEFTEGIMKRNDGKVGKLVVDDLEAAIAFLKTLPDPKNYIKTTEDVKKKPVKDWLDENPDRRVPGAHVQHTKTVTLKVDSSPMAQQAGLDPHEFTRQFV